MYMLLIIQCMYLSAVFSDVTRATLIELIPVITHILIPQQKNNKGP